MMLKSFPRNLRCMPHQVQAMISGITHNSSNDQLLPQEKLVESSDDELIWV